MHGSADTAHRLVSSAAASLLARAAAGDSEAFAAFYDLTSHQVYRLALLLSGGEDDAARLVEATYRHAWREAGACGETGLSPLAWLLAITRSVGQGSVAAA